MIYIDLYNTHKHKIFSYFFHNLGMDRALAEDLTSDTFLKGFENFDSYNDEYKFSTWIFTIARNTLYNYYKKKKVEVQMDDMKELSFEEFIKYEQDFDRKIDTEIQIEQVYKLMDSIPIGQRDIIVMKYIQDFSTEEISQMTGKTQASVRKNLSRGLNSLENMFQSLIC